MESILRKHQQATTQFVYQFINKDPCHMELRARSTCEIKPTRRRRYLEPTTSHKRKQSCCANTTQTKLPEVVRQPSKYKSLAGLYKTNHNDHFKKKTKNLLEESRGIILPQKKVQKPSGVELPVCVERRVHSRQSSNQLVGRRLYRQAKSTASYTRRPYRLMLHNDESSKAAQFEKQTVVLAQSRG